MNREGSRGFYALALCLSLVLLAVACSSGPAPPAKGSPAWYWQAAGETYGAGDYLKTNDHLESLVKPGNEYAARAQPWRMVLSGGLASGYIELADTAEMGVRANPAAASRLRGQMNLYRKQANAEAVHFAETFLAFQKSRHEGAVPLTFTFPSGSAGAVPELTRLGQGMALSEAEQNSMERRVLGRALVLAAARAVGAGDDVAKGQQAFTGESMAIPKDTFTLAMASKLHELSKLYSRSKADQPERMKLFLQEALNAVKSLPEDDKSKKLVETIEKDLKGLEKTAM
ncbi:MAG: hypothetical protein KIT09_05400 [Bryobacteraceae bacterium]|nr:hypothetical protein [Bryobacteraceae bacterium]